MNKNALCVCPAGGCVFQNACIIFTHTQRGHVGKLDRAQMLASFLIAGMQKGITVAVLQPVTVCRTGI